MRIQLQELKSLVSDIVIEELQPIVDKAIQKHMRAITTNIVAEALNINAKYLNSLNERKVITKQAEVPKPKSNDIMESILKDTAENTLQNQQLAEASNFRNDMLNDTLEMPTSEKLQKLAFGGRNLPTRSSTIPIVNSDSNEQF